MKIKLHIMLSDEANNAVITLQHTGVTYPTHTIVHEAEIEVPDAPPGFDIARITIRQEGALHA